MFKKFRSLKPRTRKSGSPPSGTDYIDLEPRQLLASFNGTAGADIVTVNLVGGVPTSIVINGTPFINPDPTLHISMDADQGDVLNLRGATFDVLGLLDFTNGTGSGSANGVVGFDFSDWLTINTEAGNDTFNITGASFATFGEAAKFSTSKFIIESGAGNDTLSYSGYGFERVELGSGNDRLIALDNVVSYIDDFDAGTGSDSWEATGNRFDLPLRKIGGGKFVFGIVGNGVFPYTSEMRGLEQVIGKDPTGQPGVVNSLHKAADSLMIGDLFYGIDADRSTIFYLPGGLNIELQNFNNFRGEVTVGAMKGTSIAVYATQYPVTVSSAAQVVMGGNVNFGNTTFINGTVRVGTNVGQLTVSDSDNPAGHNVVFGLDPNGGPTDYRLTGLAPATIFVSGTIPDIALLGTNGSNPDRFNVSATAARLTLYGNGGDDTFVIGFQNGSSDRNLDLIQGIVNVLGGAGNDYLRVDDTDSTGNFSYRVRDNWVHNSPDPSGDPNRVFAGVWNIGMETVNVRGSEGTNRFRVTPSLTTTFTVAGGLQNTGTGDRLMLVGSAPSPRGFIFLGPGSGTWYYGDTSNDDTIHNLIYFTGIEHNDGVV